MFWACDFGCYLSGGFLDPIVSEDVHYREEVHKPLLLAGHAGIAGRDGVDVLGRDSHKRATMELGIKIILVNELGIICKNYLNGIDQLF